MFVVAVLAVDFCYRVVVFFVDLCVFFLLLLLFFFVLLVVFVAVVMLRFRFCVLLPLVRTRYHVLVFLSFFWCSMEIK